MLQLPVAAQEPFLQLKTNFIERAQWRCAGVLCPSLCSWWLCGFDLARSFNRFMPCNRPDARSAVSCGEFATTHTLIHTHAHTTHAHTTHTQHNTHSHANTHTQAHTHAHTHTNTHTYTHIQIHTNTQTHTHTHTCEMHSLTSCHIRSVLSWAVGPEHNHV